MLGHVSIRVLDLHKSVDFYLAILAPLGYEAMRFPEVIGLGSSKDGVPIPDLWLRPYTPGPDNSHAEKPTPVHFSFYVKQKELVDQFYDAAMAAGATGNGNPGLRPYGMDNYYAAYVLDPDGNNVEVTCFLEKV